MSVSRTRFISEAANLLSVRTVVIIGSHSQTVVALDGDDGAVLWLCKLPGRVEAGAAIHAASMTVIVGAPVNVCACICVLVCACVYVVCVCAYVCGNNVHSGCYDGLVYALSLRTGEILGSFQTGGEVKATACIDEERGFAWVRIMPYWDCLCRP